MRVRLTQKARSDLIAISDHLTEQGSANADTVLRRIAGRYQQLSVFPNRGAARPDLLAGVRLLVVERWLVFYLVKPDAVLVLRIVDGAQDLTRLVLPPE